LWMPHIARSFGVRAAKIGPARRAIGHPSYGDRHRIEFRGGILLAYVEIPVSRMEAATGRTRRPVRAAGWPSQPCGPGDAS
jgi:hypothetical protein